MKHVTFKQTQKIVNSSTCTIYEYGGNDDIDGAVAKINGRYPQIGWAMNTEVSEIIFVLDGEGTLVTKDKEHRHTLEKNSMMLIEKGEAYHFEGKFRLFIACTPPWNSKQYVISEK